MKRALLILALIGLLPGMALAQTTVPPTPATPTTTVGVGPYDFTVNADQPLTACVTESRDSLDGHFVTLQVLVRLESGDTVPLSAVTTRATGALVGAAVEQCFVLAKETP